jgi:PPM family protein phosphatase
VTVLRSGSATDVGRVRTTNQDMPLEAPNLFAVADGMGGHAAGEVAAQIAVDTLRSSFTGHTSVDGLRQAVTDANAAVWRQSQLRSELRGMGTTLIAAALVPDTDGRDVIALANVGDSRAYVYSEAHIAQITADHSLAEEKVRHGELTEAEAAVHPHRHILTRALGVSSGVEVDLWELRLKAGDRLLLCSDGLTNEVDTTEIAGVLAAETDPAEAAHRLVAAANEHGGSDNITAVVVDVMAGDGSVPPTAGSGGNGAAAVAPVAPTPGAAVPVGGAEPSAGPGRGGDSHAGAPGVTGVGARAEDLTGAVPAQRGGSLVAASQEDSGGGVIAPPPPPGAPADEGEVEPPPSPDRRERRRQRRLAGIPRRVTLRVLFFAVLLAAVVAAAYFLVRWYATDNWFVTLDGNQVVIYQGRPGGLLWFKPTVVQRTGLTTADVLTRRIGTLRADKQEPSLAQARRYVANLRQEYQSQQAIANGNGTGSTTTTTTVPPTTTTPTITTTTTPSSPSTTSPLAAALPTTNGTI